MQEIKNVTPIKINGRNVPTEFEGTLDNHRFQNGGIFVVENKINRNLLLLVRVGGSAGWVKVKKGTGALASQNDMIIDVGINKSYAVLIESGRYMQMDGEYKGKILIETNEGEVITVIAFD